MNLRMLIIIGATWCATTATYGADKTALAKDAVADTPVTTTSVTIPVAEPTSPKPSGNRKGADVVRPGETKPTEQQIKDWNAPIKGFHPIKRMMRPLWKLRQEARSLEGNIMDLQKPMSGLQPAFASMESRMGGVQDELKSMGKELSGVNGNLHRLSGDLTHLKELSPTLVRVSDELQSLSGITHDLKELKGVRSDIRTATGHMQRLQDPLADLKGPLTSVTKPLATVQDQLTTVNGKVVRVHTQLVQMESQIAELIHEMKGLRQPMHGVSHPLTDVSAQLDSLNKLLTIILYAVATVAISMFVFGLIFIALAVKLRSKIAQVIADRK